MVYVTGLEHCKPTRKYPFRMRCKLLGDTNSECLRFGLLIGLRREWFRSGKPGHFWLTIEKRRQAILRGAEEINPTALMGLRRMYEHSLGRGELV